MPDKIEMAKAYVQIVPSADGIRAALTDVFDEETDGLGAKVGQSIGAQLVGTIKKCLPPLASANHQGFHRHGRCPAAEHRRH